MKNISLDVTKALQFLAEGTVKAYEPKVKAAQEALENGTCPGKLRRWAIRSHGS